MEKRTHHLSLMKNKILKSLLKGFVVLFALSYSLNLSSQPIIDTNTDPLTTQYPAGTFTDALGVIVLPSVKYFEYDTVDIPFVVDPTGIVEQPSSITYPCGLAIPPVTTLKIEQDTLLIFRTEPVCASDPVANDYIEFNIVAGEGMATQTCKYRIPFYRDSLKLSLVLDVSGSMARPVEGNTDNTSRWDVLKSSVSLFVKQFEVFSQPGDSISLTYFTTDTVIPDPPIGQNFILITDDSFTPVELKSSSLIDTSTKYMGPMALTALGKGLQDAKEKLLSHNNYQYKKFILLFTDGLQNQTPKVRDDGITFTDDAFLNENSPDPIDSIRYFIIATWEALTPNINYLGAIASNNKGETLFAKELNPDFSYFFNIQLSNILHGNSPQIVGTYTGKFPAADTVHSFQINKNIHTILFQISHTKNSEVSHTIKRNGVDITHLASSVTNNEMYQLISYKLPIESDNSITSDGEWEVVLNGTENKKYCLTTLIDDHYFNYKCKVDKAQYTVGDPIHLNVDLSFARNVLNENLNVKAIIVKPGDDLGHLLATFPTSDNSSSYESTDEAQEKFENLLNDSTFNEALLPQNQHIVLTYNGNGNYSGNYSNTDLTGIYNIFFLIDGQITDYGKIERSHLISTAFKFGQVEPENPVVEITDTTNTGGTASVTIRPKNKFGKFMGPGLLSKIKIEIDKKYGTIRNQKDNLDGSYTFWIDNIPVDTKPSIKILVFNETLYEGKVPPSTWPELWKIIIFLILILILLIITLLKSSNNTNTLKYLIWIITILWLLYLILVKFGIL